MTLGQIPQMGVQPGHWLPSAPHTGPQGPTVLGHPPTEAGHSPHKASWVLSPSSNLVLGYPEPLLEGLCLHTIQHNLKNARNPSLQPGRVLPAYQRNRHKLPELVCVHAGSSSPSVQGNIHSYAQISQYLLSFSVSASLSLSNSILGFYLLTWIPLSLSLSPTLSPPLSPPSSF